MVGPRPLAARWLDAEDSTSSPLQTHMAGFPSHHKYQKTVRIKITGMQYVLSAPFVPGEESPSCLPTQSETHIYRRGQWILYIQSGHCPHSCIAPKEYTEHWMRYATAFFLLKRGITGRNFSVARSAWKLYCSRKNSYREPQESASVSSVKKRLWGRKVVSSIRGYVLAERSRNSLWNTVPS